MDTRPPESRVIDTGDAARRTVHVVRWWTSLGATALVLGVMGFALATDPPSAIGEDEALRARRGDALIAVMPSTLQQGHRVALHVETPAADGSVFYGSRYDIEQRTNAGWVWRYAGSIRSGAIMESAESSQLVVTPSGDLRETAGSGPIVLWHADGISGTTEVPVDVSDLAPGSYRFRVSYTEMHPSGAHETFALAAPFSVRANL